jgi:hypothetical protein
VKHDTIRAASDQRFATVERDVTYLRTPLNWRLRIWGQGIGGYAAAEGSVSRYARQADAERTAEIWLEHGLYPHLQTAERLAATHCPPGKMKGSSTL